MQAAKARSEINSYPLRLGVAFLLIGVVTESVFIFMLNSGHFIYTLDDAYIHLALAENIIRGHYGVNLGEFSAPSSSILWPFLLAPFSSFSFGEYAPFLINVMAALWTLYFFWKIMDAALSVDDRDIKSALLSFLLLMTILATNLIGLIFTGLEHSLQLLATVAVLWGLIVEIETQELKAWLICAVVFAPLIRYENLAVSLAAVLYMYGRNHHKMATLAIFSIIVLLTAFSVFLMHLGLEPFPTSVMAKSSIVETGGTIKSVLSNLKNNFLDRKAYFLTYALLGLWYFVFFSKQSSPKKLLAGVVSLSIVLHLFMGSFGWFNRYEIYIVGFTLLTLVYLAGSTLSGLLEGPSRKTNLVKITALSALGVLLTFSGYIYTQIKTPIASNNIYEQQYQMHRFAVDYWRGPVAVNDLGYVSYKNDRYVLDLLGLASYQALVHLKNDKSPQWMNDLAKANDVAFAMIYDDHFSSLPDNWIKVGELHLGKEKLTPANSSVSFYALNAGAYAQSLAILPDFQKTLPQGVEFIYAITATAKPK